MNIDLNEEEIGIIRLGLRTMLDIAREAEVTAFQEYPTYKVDDLDSRLCSAEEIICVG